MTFFPRDLSCRLSILTPSQSLSMRVSAISVIATRLEVIRLAWFASSEVHTENLATDEDHSARHLAGKFGIDTERV